MNCILGNNLLSLFSHSVVSKYLQPHGLQPPRACSNSCLLNQWSHPIILSSFVPFSCLQSLPTKVHIVKATVFPVVMYEWMWELDHKEGWARQRTDAFELWCCRRLLRVPWTARRSNQSILKEINPEYSLEELMLKLKLQYFDHLTERADSLRRPWCWERLRARGEEDDRGRDGWMASPIQWTWI